MKEKNLLKIQPLPTVPHMQAIRSKQLRNIYVLQHIITKHESESEVRVSHLDTCRNIFGVVLCILGDGDVFHVEPWRHFGAPITSDACDGSIRVLPLGGYWYFEFPSQIAPWRSSVTQAVDPYDRQLCYGRHNLWVWGKPPCVSDVCQSEAHEIIIETHVFCAWCVYSVLSQDSGIRTNSQRNPRIWRCSRHFLSFSVDFMQANPQTLGVWGNKVLTIYSLTMRTALIFHWRIVYLSHAACECASNKKL